MSLFTADEKSVFFSYKRRDCEHVVKQIADHRFFQRCFYPKWDLWDLAHGVSWRPQLQQLIEQCDYFLFFISPGSLEAFKPESPEPVCRWEVEVALEDGVNIVPVIWEVTDNIRLLPGAVLERKPIDLQSLRQTQSIDGKLLDRVHDEMLDIILGDNSVWLDESMRWYDSLDDWRESGESEDFLLSEPEMIEFERFLRRANADVAHVLEEPHIKRFIRLNRVRWGRQKKGRF